jgi:sigma-B regulation protein RsbU (phosphoserine phosphatase)
MMLDCEKHTLDIVNAGHQWPVYFSALRRCVEPLTDAQTSMIIGVRDAEEYQAVRVSLDSGDLLVCFTDGVDEASDKPANESGKRYGRHRVEAVVAQGGRWARGAQEIVQTIHRDLEQYRAQQLDDACILCIGRRGEKCP